LSNSINSQAQPATPVPPVSIPNVAQANNARLNKRGIAILVGALAAGGVLAGLAYWKIGGYLDGLAQQKADLMSKKPASASGAKRKVVDEELPQVAEAPASTASATGYKVPDVKPQDDDAIRVVNNGQRTASASGGTQKPKRDPRDAPMLLAPSKGRSATATAAVPGPGAAGDDISQAREQIRQTREQLNSITSSLQQRMGGATAQAGAFMPAVLPGAAAMPSLPRMAGAAAATQPQLPGSEGDAAPSERAPLVAGQIADMSLTLAEGDSFTCTLSVEVVSNVSGRMKCITQAALRGADQQVVLAEKGTILTGEYNVTNVRPGTRAIAATWTRLRTPNGVTVPLRWNAISALGASGIDGHVNNRWGERIGAALLLALIDDAIKVVIADKQDNSGGGNTNIVLGGTAQTGSRMAEKVLDSTINIPPTITRGHGTVVGVDVMQDVDFSRVYALRPTR
jgi:type IV secretion system protein VirB10